MNLRAGRRQLAAAVASLVIPVGAVACTPTPTTRCPAPAQGIVGSAPGVGKTIAVTFDDGPGVFTPQILAVLGAKRVRATFFDTGLHDAQFAATTRQIAAAGHLVADHTWDHSYPSQVPGGWSYGYLADQMTRTNAQQLTLTGRTSCFFRPPGGFSSPAMAPAAQSHGMSTVLWSVDPQDWQQPGRTTAAATATIVANAEAGANQTHPIMLMHTAKASHEPEWQVSSNRSNTAAALPSIIDFYRAHGYRFVDLLGRS